MRAPAMQSLYRMNITNSTLLPDLEGLARSTAYELEVGPERLIEEYHDRVTATDDDAGRRAP